MIIKDECEVCGNRFYAETSDYVSACLREYDIWSNNHHDNCKSKQWEPEGGEWYLSTRTVKPGPSGRGYKVLTAEAVMASGISV